MSKTYTAAELAYGEVKELILSGVLPGGELISEGEIADRMSVSRTPVREAFLRLEAEGWMRLYPKRGALVVPIADGEAEQVLEARHLVEAHSARVVMDSATGPGELVAGLRANLEAQRAAAAAEAVTDFALLDADFHRLIVRAGGNTLLERFYSGLRERQRRMTANSIREGKTWFERVIADHEHLVELIAGCDADGFDAAVREHMSSAHGLGGRR
ncbi:MAG: GntR family transcriptional regulator [Mycolicibacterium sp.]|nr:GntR family transcriptional regulator [Mycolicibacterium sp.]